MNTIEYLRQFKIGPFAIFDIVLSYVGVLILSPILSWLMSKLRLKVPMSAWLWLTMPLSVIFHAFSDQSTPLMKILTNPEDFQFYLAVIVLLTMTYVGFRKISVIKR